MTVLLLEHLPGCSPINPCASCNLATNLKKKLSREDFKRLVRDMAKQTGTVASKPARFDPSESVIELKTALKGLGYVLDTDKRTVFKAS